MEKFDLKRALAGEPVVTRDGREVTEIHFFETCTKGYAVIAIIEGEKFGFTNNGYYLNNSAEHILDLFMKPKVVECWFNVYEIDGELYVGGKNQRYWESESKAKEQIHCVNGTKYIKTIKLTNAV